MYEHAVITAVFTETGLAGTVKSAPGECSADGCDTEHIFNNFYWMAALRWNYPPAKPVRDNLI